MNTILHHMEFIFDKVIIWFVRFLTKCIVSSDLENKDMKVVNANSGNYV